MSLRFSGSYMDMVLIDEMLMIIDHGGRERAKRQKEQGKIDVDMEDVLDGFREGMEGKVRGEKLVYRVAPASV